MFYCSIQSYLKQFSTCCYSLMLVSCCLFFYSKAYAQEKDTKYQQSINEIGQQIKRISKNLNNDKAQLKTERHKLFKAEKDLADITENLATTEFELAKNEHELAALELQIKSVAKSQTNNRESVKKLLLQRYQEGQPNYLKNILNQENPYAVGRLANYHAYFSKALKRRNEELSKLANEAAQLKQYQLNIVATLKEDKNKQKSQLTKQSKARITRQKSIDILDKKVNNNTQELAKLSKDRERLSNLLTQLKKQAAELKRLEDQRKRKAEELAKQQKSNTQVEPVPRVLVKGGFKKQKGRLKYPVSGVLTRKFGGRLRESGMRSEGHFFTTDGSTAVKSIFRGRVLFADFLKGYGLLIIIDHGDEHISLYGHNERLLKKVGDAVAVNEEIAKSGVTGGLKSHGLYFEIRNNATPVDPAKWCQKR